MFLVDDEIGKNKSQNANGQIGGQRYIDAVDGDAIEPVGSTAFIHITAHCFTATTGEPVTCAVIFKFEKDVKGIPLSWLRY
jgi:hypothetical protein